MEEGREVKQEPVVPSSDVPETAISATAQESKAQQIKKEGTDAERAIENDPGVNPSPRRSIRVSQRKLREQSNQQVKVKNEPKEGRTEPEFHTPEAKEVSTALNGSEQKKIVQTKQEDDEISPRRSTRNAPKRKFADEPWSIATKKSKKQKRDRSRLREERRVAYPTGLLGEKVERYTHKKQKHLAYNWTILAPSP